MGQMILADTDVLIDFLQPWHPRSVVVKAEINDVVGLRNTSISAITAMEILAGALDKADQKELWLGLRAFGLFDVNENISKLATHLVLRYKLSHNLKLADALIPATALHRDLPIYTYNRKDFQFIDGLSLHQPA